MANKARTAALAMAMLVTAATPAASDGREAIVLSVENLGGLPPHVLEAALQIAATPYDEIDVDLLWLPEGAAPSPERTGSFRLRVVLPGEATERAMLASGAPFNALAVARGSADVYIFCSRIASMARPLWISHATVLGRALAHEIGHQVLPGSGHTMNGIMNAILDYQTHKAPSFTGGQARSIQRLLLGQRTRP